MSKPTGLYPRVSVDDRGVGVVSHAGSVLLTRTATTVGLDRHLSSALTPWRKPMSVHDPGKVLLDLAVSVAIGGDALSDLGQLRAEPAVFGLVACDPTVSRLVEALAADAPAALGVIARARAAARASAWALAGCDAPDHQTSALNPLRVDIDATLVTAHSDKEAATRTFKKGYGHHPIWAFADHGQEGTGEPLTFLLRPGNAGSNTAVDHVAIIRDALAQLPGYEVGSRRPGKNVLVRIDGGGATHATLDYLTRARLGYSVGFTLPGSLVDIQERLALIPDHAWTAALDDDGDGHLPAEPRDGAWVAEGTGVFDLRGWPPGMRLIVRKERPHPGAQLRITDVDGHRITAFVTNTSTRAGLSHAKLELRHRRRARCEDRIRNAKDTGLRNLPLHAFAKNQIWCAIVALAGDLTAWMQMLALSGHQARRWEPKALRHRLFSLAGRLALTGRRRMLHLAATAPHTALVLTGLARLDALAVGPAPG